MDNEMFWIVFILSTLTAGAFSGFFMSLLSLGISKQWLPLYLAVIIAAGLTLRYQLPLWHPVPIWQTVIFGVVLWFFALWFRPMLSRWWDRQKVKLGAADEVEEAK